MFHTSYSNDIVSAIFMVLFANGRYKQYNQSAACRECERYKNHFLYDAFCIHVYIFTKISLIGSTSASMSPAPAVNNTSPNSLFICFT